MNQGGDGPSTEKKLTDVIRKELEKREILCKIKAEMMKEVLEVVRYGDKSPINQLPSEDLKSPTHLMNQLVLEYLDWVNYFYSSDVLASESGVTKRATRKELEGQLKSKKDFDAEFPILYEMMMRFMKEK